MKNNNRSLKKLDPTVGICIKRVLKKKSLFFLLIFMISVSGVYSQSPLSVTGAVGDENGVPLLGATVILKDSNIGTVTDEEGKYEISVPNDNGILVFSYIGFITQEIPVNGKSVVDVNLQPDNNELDEVIVVGYGTQKKSDLTGAISSVSEEDIKNFAVPNASQLLQGKAAGVYVSTSSGQPGAEAIIRIRGFGTVNDNNPLYVVDGQFFDNINNLNPADIQNIEILKDASATSIYGSRGSNGVILITTKMAKEGQNIASFDSYVGFKNSYRSPNMMNSEQFYNFTKLATEDVGQTLDPKFVQQYQRGFDTDWWEAVNRSALTQNYVFSIRKGGENYRSYFSLGYLDDNGAIITTDFSRVSLKLNNEYDLSSRFKVGANLGLVRNNSSNSESLPRFDFVLQPDPFTPVINPLVDVNDPNYEYNKYAPTEYSFNPNAVSVLELTDRESEDFNFFGNIYANWEIFDDLKYYAQFNYEHNNNRYKEFFPIYNSVFTEFNLANREGKFRNQAQLSNSSAVNKNYLIEQRLNYSRTFGKHALDVMVATTFEENEFENISAFKSNTPGNDKEFRVLDAATIGPQASGGKGKSSILSYLGRLNYNFEDRYLATVSFRADGSSRFAEGNKWGSFPAFSLAWRVSNEKFFENLNVSRVVSNVKIRAGWGQTGNQRIDLTAPLTLIGTGIDRQLNFGSGFEQGYYPTYRGNPNIQWETSQQTNIGLDIGLFGNSLTLNFEYYDKTTQDMLLQVPVPAFSGFPNYPFSNAGDVENKGFEISLNYSNNIDEFTYSIGGNISKYENKVTSLGKGDIPLFGAASKTVVGGPINRLFGYVWEGIFQNQSEIDNYLGPEGQIVQPVAIPGDFKFADLNNDGTINDDDRTYIGNPHPDLIYGFNISVAYKGIDLISSFQGTLGNDIYNSLKTYGIPGLQNGLASAYTNAWLKEGDVNASYPRPSLRNDNNNYRASSWYIEDGSFLRVQNVQLGYTIEPSIVAKTKFLSSCRVYLSGQNLFTFTKYSGLDPELGSNSPLTLGYDGIRYPSSRTILMGMNVEF